MTLDRILEKRAWRSDALWTTPVAYRSFLRYIPLYFDTRALMRSQYWPRERLDTLRDVRLATLLDEARSVPYWRELIERSGEGRSIEVLSRMPVTSKFDLRDRPFKEIADMALVSRSDPDQTSGSTGAPFHFRQDWRASLRSFAFVERTFRTMVKKRYPIVYVRARPRNGFTFHKHIWFFVRGFNSIGYRIEALLSLAHKLRDGFIIYSYTSWVARLAREIEARGERLAVKAVCVAGEHLTQEDRALIERVFRAPLFSLYASREVGFLGYECERHRMHLNEEWAYVEILSEEGRPVKDGAEGRVVVTCFDNRVMPFIRYDIGDIGAIDRDVCPCGRTLRTIRFRGRQTELIELEGRSVALLDVAHAMGQHRGAVAQYQFVQKGPLDIVVRVVPGARFEEHREDLTFLLVRLLHPRVRIVWETVAAIPAAPSGKAVYFVRDTL